MPEEGFHPPKTGLDNIPLAAPRMIEKHLSDGKEAQQDLDSEELVEVNRVDDEFL